MDILLETMNTLKDKGWYEELQTEFQEAINNINQGQQEQLLHILNSDKVTLAQIKELFMSSVNTSKVYKISKLVK